MADTAEPRPAKIRIDTGGVLNDAWRLVEENWRSLVVVGWLPFLVYFVFGGPFNDTSILVLLLAQLPSTQWIALPLYIIGAVGYSAFCVAAHRLFILKEQPQSAAQFKFKKREALFLVILALFFLVLYIFVIGMLFVLQLLFYILFYKIGGVLGSFTTRTLVMFSAVIVIMCLWLTMFSRLSLALPRIAVESKVDFLGAVHHSKGIVWSFFGQTFWLSLKWGILMSIYTMLIGTIFENMNPLYQTPDSFQLYHTFFLIPYGVLFFGFTANSVALWSAYYSRVKHRWP